MIKKKDFLFNKKNVPNILVIVRMVLTVFIVGLLICKFYNILGNIVVYSTKDIFLKNNQPDNNLYCFIDLYQLLAGLLFIIACFSDFLDGFIARKYNCVSLFGKIWDPIADKILVNSVLICFATLNFIPVFIPIIMVARDVIVDAKRMLTCMQNVDVSANIYGKLKTFLQMWGIIFIFFICSFTNTNNEHMLMWWLVQNLLMYSATLMSIFSAGNYLFAKHTNNDHKN